MPLVICAKIYNFYHKNDLETVQSEAAGLEGQEDTMQLLSKSQFEELHTIMDVPFDDQDCHRVLFEIQKRVQDRESDLHTMMQAYQQQQETQQSNSQASTFPQSGQIQPVNTSNMAPLYGNQDFSSPASIGYLLAGNPEFKIPQEVLHSTHGKINLADQLSTYVDLVDGKTDKPGVTLSNMLPASGGLSSTYQGVMPLEYYANIISREKNRADGERWYNRPHHIESLTEHPFSLRDNVLDSKYRSTYQEFDRDIHGPIYDTRKTPESKPSEAKGDLIEEVQFNI